MNSLLGRIVNTTRTGQDTNGNREYLKIDNKQEEQHTVYNYQTYYKAPVTPFKARSKLNSLSKIERASLLYHKAALLFIAAGRPKCRQELE